MIKREKTTREKRKCRKREGGWVPQEGRFTGHCTKTDK